MIGSLTIVRLVSQIFGALTTTKMAALQTTLVQQTSYVQQIIPVVKDYAWGIRGSDSRVARYALESGSIPAVDPAAPYAELWIGTHPSVRFKSFQNKSLSPIPGLQIHKNVGTRHV